MIPVRMHGVIDYLVAIVLIAAPFLLGFADDGPAQWSTIGFGVIALVYSALTDYPLGLFGVIPFRGHLIIDLVFAVLLSASPWVLGFSDLIWWPHLLLGIAAVLVVSLSRRTKSS